MRWRVSRAPTHNICPYDGCPVVFAPAKGLTDFADTYQFPPIPHIGAREEPRHEYFLTLYPNLVISTGAEHVLVAMVLPLSPVRCEASTILLFDPSVAAGSEADTIRGIYEEAVRQDSVVMEAVQKARRSPAFPSQFYSPAWDTLHYHMTQMILDDLETP